MHMMRCEGGEMEAVEQKLPKMEENPKATGE
jgi:hypothetical protein